jgi:adenine-specific DNA-methyltransferase
VIDSALEKRIKQKIELIGTPLRNWDIRINYGIKTGFNDAFIITGERRKELISLDVKSEEIIRPILRGRDIKRYGYNFADLWLIDVHNGIKQTGLKPINIELYPAIKAHLDKNYKELEERTDKGDTPYNLRNCAYMEDFSKQKIVWGNLNLKASYSIAPNNMYVSAPCPMIVPASKYLLAFLNSKVADYYVRSLGVTRNGGYFEYKPMFIEKLPIPIGSENTTSMFDDLISTIIQAKQNNVDTGVEEEMIDNMIFDIYNLDEEEKQFIKSQ